MTTTKVKGKRQPKTRPGSDNLPHILAQAKQVVDTVTEASPASAAPPKKTAPPPEALKKTRKAPPKKAAPRKPARSPAPSAPKKKAPAPKTKPLNFLTVEIGRALSAWETKPSPAPSLSPEDCGIRVVHALPGRVRVRLKKCKHDPRFAREVQDKLAAIQGIITVQASPTTGSLLITYRSKELIRQPLAQALTTWYPGLNPEPLMACFS